MNPRALIVTSCAAFAIVGLVGCGAHDHPRSASSASSRADPDTQDINLGHGTTIRSRALVSSFPLDDVPLVDGDIQESSRETDNPRWEWAVSLRRDSGLDATLAEATKLLENAGYTASTPRFAPDRAMNRFEKEGFEVTVSIIRALRDDSQVTLAYFVRDTSATG